MRFSTILSVTLLSFSLATTLPYAIDAANANDAPISNYIGDIVFDGECLWVATGSGVSRTCDGGITWETYLDGKSFSAMTYGYGSVYLASSFDTVSAGEGIPVGEGLYRSYTSEPISFEKLTPWQLVYVPGTSFFAMLSYDICFVPLDTDTAILSANWYGGLSRSLDWGQTWELINWNCFVNEDSGTVSWLFIPAEQDTIREFVSNNSAYNNRKFFAIASDTSIDFPIIYIATASGIFAVQDTVFWRADPDRGLLGSWCVALAVQYRDTGENVIWAASRSAADGESDGICFSIDNGHSWDTLFSDTVFTEIDDSVYEEHIPIYVMCWNIAYCGDTVFFACEQGFYRTVDRENVEKVDIVDFVTGERLPMDVMISVIVVGETLWVGSDFGLAYSTDCGVTFRILIHKAEIEEGRTYAFPSPFSPHEYGSIFFVFDNDVKGNAEAMIFDFALDEVATIVKYVDIGDEQSIQWDGKKTNGEYPANGIYFYKISLPDGRELWGKFAFIR